MKQGSMSLENLWNKFQKLWISIDETDPNPMDTPEAIEKYNRNTQRHRLYQFLWALDDKYDGIKREILNKDPLPSVRTAYGLVRREFANERVLKPLSDQPESGIGAGLAAIQRGKPPQARTGMNLWPQARTTSPSGPPPTRIFPTQIDRSKMTCSHCGGRKHTSETCFHIHGFPEWWEDFKKSRQEKSRNGNSRATTAAEASTGATNANNSAGSLSKYNAGGSNAKSAAQTEKTINRLLPPYRSPEYGQKVHHHRQPPSPMSY